jgi:hypothetical protein
VGCIGVEFLELALTGVMEECEVSVMTAARKQRNVLGGNNGLDIDKMECMCRTFAGRKACGTCNTRQNRRYAECSTHKATYNTWKRQSQMPGEKWGDDQELVVLEPRGLLLECTLELVESALAQDSEHNVVE